MDENRGIRVKIEIFINHNKIGQFNCIKQTSCSEIKVTSRDSVSIFLFKMRMFLLSWNPTIGFMQCLDQLKFLEYLLEVEHEGGRNADGKEQFLMSTIV